MYHKARYLLAYILNNLCPAVADEEVIRDDPVLHLYLHPGAYHMAGLPAYSQRKTKHQLPLRVHI